MKRRLDYGTSHCWNMENTCDNICVLNNDLHLYKIIINAYVWVYHIIFVVLFINVTDCPMVILFFTFCLFVCKFNVVCVICLSIIVVYN